MKAIVYLPHCWIQTMDPAPRRIIMRIATKSIGLFGDRIVTVQGHSWSDSVGC